MYQEISSQKSDVEQLYRSSIENIETIEKDKLSLEEQVQSQKVANEVLQSEINQKDLEYEKLSGELETSKSEIENFKTQVAESVANLQVILKSKLNNSFIFHSF
jgi:chromosome segregation ATPase